MLFSVVYRAARRAKADQPEAIKYACALEHHIISSVIVFSSARDQLISCRLLANFLGVDVVRICFRQRRSKVISSP